MKKDNALKKVYLPDAGHPNGAGHPVKKKILPRLASFIAAIVLLLLPPARTARAVELSVPEVSVKDGEILVTSRLTLDDGLVKEIKEGVQKKLIIHVDLFKEWRGWADEFILGKKIEREISCDEVKKEYTMRQDEGGTFKNLRFESCDELLSAALAVKALRLASTGEIRMGPYFVKVSAESRLRDMPPLLNLMFFFIREKEFSIDENSPEMRMGTGR